LSRKAAALLEVVGVLVMGWAASGNIMSFLGISSLGAGIQSALQTAKPDFITLSLDWSKVMCIQYACLLLPAFALGWWRRRLDLRYYGVTTAGQSPWILIVSGLVGFALVAMPFKLLWVARRFIPLGSGPAYWGLLDKSWTPSFWLFLAVSSFVLTPVLEELLYRGYCQTRLEEEFGGVGAIVIVTLVMTLGHNQYFHLSFLDIGTLLSMIPLVLGMGYMYWRSRSLIPAMIIHALVNLPTRGIYDFLVPAVMLTALIVFRQRWLGMVRDFCRHAVGKGWKRAAFAATALAITLVIGYECRPGWFIVVALCGLAVALFIESKQRQLGTPHSEFK
jgi:membrane protease YdiL (CAAX protease family)